MSKSAWILKAKLTLPVLMAGFVLTWPGVLSAEGLEDCRRLLTEAHSFNRLIRLVYGPRPAPASRAAIAVAVIDKKDPLPYLAEIGQASDRFQIPKPLIAAIIRCESNWDPRAHSPKGARGLMQVLPRTAMNAFGVQPAHLWSPGVNIRVGTAYLRVLAGRYRGDASKVIAAYNAGPTRVDAPSRLPRETRLYKRCVSSWHARYARLLR